MPNNTQGWYVVKSNITKTSGVRQADNLGRREGTPETIPKG